MMPTVQALLLQAMRRFRDRPCVRWEGGSATYAETTVRTVNLASWMQGVSGAGDGVAILLDNSREYIETILATALAGRVRVPLNAREPAATTAHKIEAVGAKIVIASEAHWGAVAESLVSPPPEVVLVDGPKARLDPLLEGDASSASLRPAAPGELYRLSFTGGTTGTPKAVMQTHRQELAMMRNLLLEVIEPDAETCFVAATPLSHASGAFVVPTVIGGGSLAWTGRFDAAKLVDASWLDGELRIETFLVPTALADVAEAAVPGHALKTVVYGGAPCPTPTLELAVERLGLCLVQVYGQAEAPMTICVLGREDHTDTAAIEGSPGRPFTFVDVRIERDGERLPDGEVGEVVVYAEHTMEGYLGAAAETSERLGADGSIRTQDRGYFDEAGRLRLVGRDRELIISGGFNVFPDEVERRIGGLAGVREQSIFAVPHARWGEGVVLAVVPEDGIELNDETVLEELRGRAQASLASYEVPKQVVVLDRLPTTGVGKVSRADLSQRFADLFADG